MKISTLSRYIQDKVKSDDPESKSKRPTRNPVAKNSRAGLGKATVMQDRKRAAKRGKVKHKHKMFESLFGDSNIFSS